MNDNEVSTINQTVTGEAEASVYFWLGSDEAAELTEEDFHIKIAATRQARDDFFYVR